MSPILRRLEHSGFEIATSRLRMFGTLTLVLFEISGQNMSHRILKILAPINLGFQHGGDTHENMDDRIPIVDRQNHNSDTFLDRQHPI